MEQLEATCGGFDADWERECRGQGLGSVCGIGSRHSQVANLVHLTLEVVVSDGTVQHESYHIHGRGIPFAPG